MSFVLVHKPLFKVAVVENGTTKALPGLTFEPTAVGRRALTDHQLIFRPREAGFAVFCRSNPLAADPLLAPITSETRYTFRISLRDTGFFKLYEPELTAATGAQLYLDNRNADGNVVTRGSLAAAGDFVKTNDAVRVVPGVFTVTLDRPSANPPTKILVKTYIGSTDVEDFAIEDTGGGTRTITKIDLAKYSPGAYTIETDATGSPKQTIYVDDELARTSALGIVDLYWDSRQDTAPAAGATYSIGFKKR